MNPQLLSAVIKTHSLLADLLSPQQIIALAKAETTTIFTQSLAETPYAQKLMTPKINSRVLEKAFHQVFMDRIATLWKIVPRNIAQFIQTYYMKFDFFNLKRIIQGKSHEASPTQIEDALLLTAFPSSASYHDEVNLPSLNAVIRSIEKRFQLPSRYVELYQQYGEVWPLELAVDQHYATMVRTAIQRLPRAALDVTTKIAGVEIDVNTLLFTISHKGPLQKHTSANEVKTLFSAPFQFPLDIITKIIESDDMKTVINNFPNPYKEILTPLYQSNELHVLLKLRQYLYEEAQRHRLLNDFSYNVIFAYLVFCEIERNNLVGLALKPTTHVASDDVLQYIVLPGNVAK